MIACPQYRAPNTCTAGHYGGKPSPGTCHHCPHRPANTSHLDTPLSPLTISAKPIPAILAIARADWPLAASALARLAVEADTGLGDTFHRLINDSNPITKAIAVAFQAAVKLMGWDCSCSRRHREWNQRFPLP